MSEIAYTLRMYYKRFADTMQRGETIGTEVNDVIINQTFILNI